jgi:hypothetical protein
MKYGRRLKGPVLLTPKEFNKVVEGDGIGFKTVESEKMMRIPQRAEGQHIELMGVIGSGNPAPPGSICGSQAVAWSTS